MEISYNNTFEHLKSIKPGKKMGTFKFKPIFCLFVQ